MKNAKFHGEKFCGRLIRNGIIKESERNCTILELTGCVFSLLI